MSVETLDSLIKQVDSLTTDEQLRLAAYLVERARETYRSVEPCREWQDLRGLLLAPALGEDAQAWVSRTRREADEQREHARRANP
jgi:hypothetical protein